MPRSPLTPIYYGDMNSSSSSLVPLNPINTVPTSSPSATPKTPSALDDSHHQDSDSDTETHGQEHFQTQEQSSATFLSTHRSRQQGQRAQQRNATSAASTAANSPLLSRPLILPGSVMGGTPSNPLGIGRQASQSSPSSGKSKRPSWKLIASYVSDWATLIVFAMVAYVTGNVSPIRRPFSLENSTISFPFTEHETVPIWLLLICNAAAPILIIALVVLLFVPGPTVPRGTPRSMIWRRKLWELHTGWLGLALAMCAATFVTNGLKNMYGKPRPDLLVRCQPDLANQEKYLIGARQLVDSGICTQTNTAKLDDGFRSFPSGHSSSAAAGLIYLSLFIASKFTITIPFVTPGGYHQNSDASFAAFPSRLPQSPPSRPVVPPSTSCVDEDSHDPEAQALNNISSHSRAVLAVRRQAAAPPLYLFGIAVLPVFVAVFIASSRWFDYRHHAFDIFSGFLIGTLSAILGFRYYHMPISQGAGWAWGPRSVDKAFWAGLGSYSFATDKKKYYIRAGDEEEALEASGATARTFSDRNNDAAGAAGGAGVSRHGTGHSSSQPTKAAVDDGESTSIHSRA